MTKERLEEIKNKQNTDHLNNNLVAKYVKPPFVSLSNDDYSWLIEQTETYQKCNVAYDELTHEFNLLKKQNKRYRDEVRKAVGHFNQDEHPEGMAILQSLLRTV